MSQISKSQQQLLGALCRHLKVLKESYSKVFQNGDKDYLPELASKLRVLVCSSRTNTPLLFHLMKIFNKDVRLKFDYPFGSEERSLHDYLSEENISYGHKITNLEIIAVFANKFGSHEDLEVPDYLFKMINDPIRLNGSQPVYLQLRAITRTVISFTEAFLEKLK